MAISNMTRAPVTTKPRAPLRRIVALLFLGGVVTSQADSVRLDSGKTVIGEVRSLREGTFEVVQERDQVIKVPVKTVTDIDFLKGTVPAVVERPGLSNLTGKAWLVARGALHFENAGGETTRIPLSTISVIHFNTLKPPAPPPATPPTQTKTSPGLPPSLPPPAPAKSEPPTPAVDPKPSTASIQLIGRSNRVDVTQHTVPGKVLIVDFYADWCAPCRQVAPVLEARVKGNTNILLRKVDIVSWESPVAQQYNIKSVPFIQIYDVTGKKAGELQGFDSTEFNKLVEKAEKPAPAWHDWPVVRWLF